jgi:hypothetical protein
MLREALSNLYSIILHPLNSLLQFYIFCHVWTLAIKIVVLD